MPQYECKVISAGPEKDGGVILGLKHLATPRHGLTAGCSWQTTAYGMRCLRPRSLR
jgi:hypothetical protein